MRAVLGGCLFVIGGLLIAADPPPLPKDTLPESWPLDKLPKGLHSAPVVPKDNPLSPERVRLGRRLFFDPILSEDRTVSCATCHDPNHAFSTPLSIGIHGQRSRRNAPSLLNVGLGKSFFWDGRADSLKNQALMPLSNPTEMGSDDKAILKRLRADKTYQRQFQQAFGEGVSRDNLARALASFERSLLSGDSPVDRFRSSETSALTTPQKQGLWLFESRANCWRCHSGNNLTDENFHNTGVSWGKAPLDLGRFEVTGKDSDRGAFKTPTLRNVALTAPYMHDGSMKTLREVVQFYNKGGRANPHLDDRMRPLKLSDSEVDHLVAFLEALTGKHVRPVE